MIEPNRKHFRLKDQTHAVSCLQWHALKAALAAFKRELAPSASNDDGNSTGTETQ